MGIKLLHSYIIIIIIDLIILVTNNFTYNTACPDLIKVWSYSGAR